MGNRLGQNDRNDRGIISGFHQKSDFDSCFTCQSPCFLENPDFHVLCLTNVFFLRGQICEVVKINRSKVVLNSPSMGKVSVPMSMVIAA